MFVYLLVCVLEGGGCVCMCVRGCVYLCTEEGRRGYDL